MCIPWKPGDRTPVAVVSTVTVAKPPAKSMVALATGLPSADFNSAVMVSAPCAAEVVDELGCSLVVSFEQPANMATGAASRAAVAVTCLNMTVKYPKRR